MWGVPVDHEYFESINTAQWYWYLNNLVEDQEEEFAMHRNLIEYHASFLEPELVDKTRKRRNETDANSKKDAQFSSTIKSLFGREIALPDQPAKESGFKNVHEVSNILDKVNEYDAARKKIKSQSTYNFTDWVDFELE